MLFAFYAARVFLEDSDSVTSLFFAAALIVFAMPGSIYDVGLWLSFLATLGILVIYPLISTLVVAKKTGNGTKLCAFPRMILRYVLTAAAVTFSANILIIALSAFVFEEFSLLSVPANIAVSPLGTLFLILIPFVLIFGGIPFIGSVFSGFASLTAGAIVNITRTLSGMPFGVVSLSFAFARIIVILMSAAFAVLLVVDLKKRKCLILAPFALGVCAYVTCFSVWNAANKDKISVHFAVEGKNETLVMSKGTSSAVCDISGGTADFLNSSVELAKRNYATEIDDFVLTHYHERQATSLDYIMRRVLVRRLYLPVPATDEEINTAVIIAESCRTLGVELEFYGYGEQLNLLKNIRFIILEPEYIGRSVHPVISLAAGGKSEKFTYVGSAAPETSEFGTIKDIAEASEYVIFGAHGPVPRSDFPFFFSSERTKAIFFADSENSPADDSAFPGISAYVFGRKESFREIYFRIK